MQFAPEVLDKLADSLAKAGYLSTRAQMISVVKEVAAQMSAGKGRFDSANSDVFSISRAIRGLTAAAGHVSNTETREADIGYAQRTLLTGTTPGSYLVPTFQADQIVQLLTSLNVIRLAGARIWPMGGMQKLNVPVATAAPTIVWGNSAGSGGGGQGATLTPSDPNLGQLSFDLKTAKALTAIPNELLATSVPAVDEIVSQIMALAFAQEEMNSMVASTTGTGKPVPVYAAAGTTVINANNNSANGGALLFKDLLAVVGQFYTQKGKGLPCWFMHPTVFYKDLMGLTDTSSRPIITGFESLEKSFQGKLFGYSVYVSAEFPTNQAVGSGSSQSYAIFTNPLYLNIADRGSLELSVSFERFFDANETAIRAVRAVDYGYAPSAAVILLAGINV